MAKKTTKTTVKHTKKGTVTKTVTKKSKKGLIIGIVVGALVLAGGGAALGILLPKLLNKDDNSVKFSVDKTTITLDDSLKTNLKLDWKPSDHSIECSKFTFTLKNQTDITADVKAGEVGSRPLDLTITFSKEFEGEYKGDLKFNYNDKTAKKEGEGKVTGIKVKMQDTPEPTDKLTFGLSKESQKYGTLTYGGKSEVWEVDISDMIGKEGSVEIGFIPEKIYEGQIYNIELVESGKLYDVKFNEDDKEKITIKPTKEGEAFKAGELIAKLEPKGEVKFNLADDGSRDYGSLSNEGDYDLDISSYVGETKFPITFYPKDEYKNREFNVTIVGVEGTIEATYDKILFTFNVVCEDFALKDGDILKASLDLVEIASLTVDQDSKDFGSFSKDEGLYTIDIGEYVGYNEFTVSYFHNEAYNDNEIKITVGDGTKFNADYNKDNNEIKFTGISSHTLQDKEDLTLKIAAKINITLKAGDGYFGVDDPELVISDIYTGSTFAEYIEGEDKPLCDDKITPDDSGPELDQIFIYYTDNSGIKVKDDYKVMDDLTVTAKYGPDCLGFENVDDDTHVMCMGKSTYDYEYGTIPNVSYAFLSDIDNWETLNFGEYQVSDYIDVPAGETIYFKGSNSNGFSKLDEIRFAGGWRFNCVDGAGEGLRLVAHGNIMGLIDNGACETTTIPENSTFNSLLSFSTLDIADDFILTATALPKLAYAYMFASCRCLTKAPTIPATSMSDDACSGMFEYCNKLIKPAVFSANEITVSGATSFWGMYSDCTSLDEIPDLSNIKFGSEVDSPFLGMFNECISLTTVEKNKIPVVNSDVDGLCTSMFYNCTSLTTVDISNITAANGAIMFQYMFYGCTKLSSLTVGFGNSSNPNYWPFNDFREEAPTIGWLDGAGTEATNPVFIWNGVTTTFPQSMRDVDHIPSGWTIKNPA